MNSHPQRNLIITDLVYPLKLKTDSSTKLNPHEKAKKKKQKPKSHENWPPAKLNDSTVSTRGDWSTCSPNFPEKLQIRS